MNELIKEEREARKKRSEFHWPMLFAIAAIRRLINARVEYTPKTVRTGVLCERHKKNERSSREREEGLSERGKKTTQRRKERQSNSRPVLAGYDDSQCTATHHDRE